MPVWWLLGLKPIILQLNVILFFFIILLLRGFRFPPASKLLFAYILIYFSSLISNIHLMPFARGLGSFANLLLWFCGAVIILFIYNNSFQLNRLVKLSKSVVFISIISSLIVLIGLSYFYQGSESISLVSPSINIIPKFLINNSEIIRDSLSFTIVRPDYTILGTVPRSAGLFAYPNALALGVISSFPFLANPNVIKRNFTRKILFFLLFIALIGSGSRSTIIGFLIATIFIGYIATLSYNAKFFFRHIALLLIGIALLSFLIISLKPVFDLLSSFRPGSTRINVFMQTINSYIDQGNWLFGMGYKPRIDLFNHPIGGHSTYFGVLMKTGIIGLLVITIFVIYTFLRIIRVINKVKYYKNGFPVLFHCICILTCMMWMVVEDIDAPPLASVSFFISLGIFYLPKRILFSFYNSYPKQAKAV